MVWGVDLLAWRNREIRVWRWFRWRDWWVLGRVVVREGSGGAERRRAPLWWVGVSRRRLIRNRGGNGNVHEEKQKRSALTTAVGEIDPVTCECDSDFLQPSGMSLSFP